MKEDFINFLWQYRLFNSIELLTTNGQALEIIQPGLRNRDSGPDFSAARIKIDGTLWAGNVEVHIRSSDWHRHGHQIDAAYNNVILHVVMEHDMEITDTGGNLIPVFEIRNYFDMALYYRYEKFLISKTWIPCEKFIEDADPFIVANWLSRLLVERLENKSVEILQFFDYFNGSWDQTFYYFLARNFGFKVNASPFALVAQSTPFQIIAKHRDDLTILESLFFGQAGLLEKDFNDAYPVLLKREYKFLQHKYDLKPIDAALWKWGKLRPPNFPSIRIAQFARLMHHSGNLFDTITENVTIEQYVQIFNAQCSPYWNTHYRFDLSSGNLPKNLGIGAVENIIINTVVPLKFVYGKQSLKSEIQDQAIALIMELKPEENSIISNWMKMGIKPSNASESQALLHLKKYYCTPRKCLECAIGHNLVRNKRKHQE